MIDNYRILFKCVHGSHLYGTNTENSDKDYVGVFMPRVSELLLGTSPKQIKHSTGDPKSKNTSEDVDTTWFSLPEFIRLAAEGETIAMDALHAYTYPEMVLQSSPEWEFIVENRKKFYTKNMKAFVGYAKKQAAKYGVKGSRMAALEEVYNTVFNLTKNKWHICKLSDCWNQLPVNDYCKFVTDRLKSGEIQNFYEVLGSKYQSRMPFNQFVSCIEQKWDSYGERARAAKENNGIDWKAVSHALRAAFQLQAIMHFDENNAGIKYPLYDREYLKSVKNGKLDFLTQVQPDLERSIRDVELRAINSSLPDKVDMEFWNNWLLNVYKTNILVDM